MKLQSLLSGFAAVCMTMASAVFADAATPPSPIVAIDTGKLSGQFDGAIQIYRGIPYAAAPVGAWRWRPPQRAQSWSGVRDASKFGASCPQASEGKLDILLIGGAPEPTSEDCLTLNVWAPAHLKKRAPVMVWFHGGAGRIGSGALPYYNGASFARDGVVLVTVNYRLGHLGAFAYPGLSDEAEKSHSMVGDYALMDQIESLKWVKRNIAAFGGDANNVTIFGESSGGISVFKLLAAPAARGFFQKAIIESGTEWLPPPPSLANAKKRGKAIAVAAGARPNATLTDVRALPAQAIMRVPGESSAAPDPSLQPESPTISVADGSVAAVPLIIGVTDGEDSLINGSIAKAKAAISADTLSTLRGLYGANLDAETAARYQFRDAIGTAPARWAAAHWPAPAYLYRFEHVTESYKPERKRAVHGAEIFYVFDTLGREPDKASRPTPADEALAKQIHARWVAFAFSGSPNLPGVPHWPASSSTDDQWMVFGQDRTAVKDHLMKAQLDYYDGKIEPIILYLRVTTTLSRWANDIASWFK